MAIDGDMSINAIRLGNMYYEDPRYEYTHHITIDSLSLSLSMIYNNCTVYTYTLVHCNDLYAQLLFIFTINRRSFYE